ncbi:MAG: signal peptidase I [Alphaproteobacteria bacterium]|nr:signal peptidase I [Alphaproteobacteria bacterium]
MSTTETQTKPKEKKEESIGDLAKTAFLAILLAMVIRTFLFEPFNIPSGSMVPNLLVGDYLFVSKYSYGYSKHSFPFSAGGFEGRVANEHLPQRGDIAVFKLPTNTSIDYIKRVIGLPDDKLQMIGGQLYINKKIVPRELLGLKEYTNDFGSTSEVVEYMETLPNNVMHIMYERDDYQSLDNTEEFTIPKGHYFMMGDNRDNSQDSRVMSQVGFVPLENFVGQAKFIFFSTNGSARIYEIWKWPFTIRYDRLFDKIL